MVNMADTLEASTITQSPRKWSRERVARTDWRKENIYGQTIKMWRVNLWGPDPQYPGAIVGGIGAWVNFWSATPYKDLDRILSSGHMSLDEVTAKIEQLNDTTRLERIASTPIGEGEGFRPRVVRAIGCKDGTRLSIQASDSHLLSSPRQSNVGPWTNFCVMFYVKGGWSGVERGMVPFDELVQIINKHGGEKGWAGWTMDENDSHPFYRGE